MPSADRFESSNMPDLAKLGQNQSQGPGGDGGGFVVDVTEQNFGEIMQTSTQVPVVIDLWAPWSEICGRVNASLEKLAVEFAGKVMVAKVDVDANPQIFQAFQGQSVPTVMALVAGQPVALFAEELPEEQIRQVLNKLLEVAAENGVTGTLSADEAQAAAEVEPEPVPPLHQAGYDALEAGDLASAAASFEQALRENPADDVARAAAAQVHLLIRTENVDPAALLATAQANPDDVDAQLAAADIEVATSAAAAAFDRLIALIKRTFGPDRERIRVRLVEYFDVVGGEDPAVVSARRQLFSALY